MASFQGVFLFSFVLLTASVSRSALIENSEGMTFQPARDAFSQYIDSKSDLNAVCHYLGMIHGVATGAAYHHTTEHLTISTTESVAIQAGPIVPQAVPNRTDDYLQTISCKKAETVLPFQPVMLNRNKLRGLPRYDAHVPSDLLCRYLGGLMYKNFIASLGTRQTHLSYMNENAERVELFGSHFITRHIRTDELLDGIVCVQEAELKQGKH